MYHYHITNHFKRQLKPYGKKYETILDDVISALKNFEPARSVALGKSTYKLRLRASNLPEGKSHAFRLIIVLLELNQIIAPITIYFKGDKDDIPRKEIRHHVNAVQEEIAKLP